MRHRGITFWQVVLIAALSFTAAAILAPIGSAQGSKGNPKSWLIGQLHILGTNMNLYANDWSDVLPPAGFRSPDGGPWRFDAVPTPADCVTNAPWNTPLRIAATRSVWRNVILPYGPPYSLPLPGAPEVIINGDQFVGEPIVNHAVMNGLLHAYPSASIDHPEIVPMLWSGLGRVNLKGRSWTNPWLQCDSWPTCRFNPNAPPAGNVVGNAGMGYYDTSTSYWIYNQTAPFVRVDSSVAVLPIGTKTEPNAHEWPNVTTDPWRSVTSIGRPISYWTCGPGHTTNTPNLGVTGNQYPCYFRPDRSE